MKDKVMVSPFFKGMTLENITQIFHEGHLALDIISNNRVNSGYGTPLTAPERCQVLGTTAELITHDDTGLVSGYGIRLLGLETGMDYLYWHCNPIFPVSQNDHVERGQIVAFMGNAGDVSTGGQYVPIDKRTVAPFLGTHLHIQLEKKGTRLDPLLYIDFSLQPNYGLLDLVGAISKVLLKITSIIGK